MPRRARAPGERAGLDAAAVVGAAVELSARHGVKGLSMRRLAAELGVTANTLYSYFPSKGAVVAALVDHLIGEVPAHHGVDATWQESVVRALEHTRRALLPHHELVTSFLGEPTTGPNALRLAESVRAALEQGGLTGKPATDALRVALVYTFGFAALGRPPAGVKASRRESPEPFQQGLVWLLDGIAAWTARHRSGDDTPR